MKIPELDINLPALKKHLRYKNISDRQHIWDPCRRIWLITTREEIVRQLWIAWFIHQQGISKNRIISEKLIKINDLKRRFDILILDRNLNPVILVECKAPEIDLDQNVFDQIAVYNLALKAPYLLVSNGYRSIICEIDFTNKKYQFLSTIPKSIP